MGVNLVQNADGSLGFLDELTGYQIAKLGGPSPLQGTPAYRIPTTLELNVVGPTDTAGALAALANPFSRAFYIVDTLLAVTTASSGACTVSIGCAANATTINSTLLSAQNVAATGIFGGGLVANRQIWTPTLFLTASTQTGASSGLISKLLVTGHFL